MRLAFVPEGGRAARQTLAGALRAAWQPGLPPLGSWPAVMSSSTENERKFAMSETRNHHTLTVTLYGNLGRDPEIRTTRERVFTRAVYDAVIDDAVEREYCKPGRELRTFTLAVNAKDAEDQPLPTRWHRCIDWQGCTADFRQGDYVALTGFFKVRKYVKDGEAKEIRQLVVTGAKLLCSRTREQVA
jgi:single-stranded DNA-binding protein